MQCAIQWSRTFDWSSRQGWLLAEKLWSNCRCPPQKFRLTVLAPSMRLLPSIDRPLQHVHPASQQTCAGVWPGWQSRPAARPPAARPESSEPYTNIVARQLQSYQLQARELNLFDRSHLGAGMSDKLLVPKSILNAIIFSHKPSMQFISPYLQITEKIPIGSTHVVVDAWKKC